MLFNSIEFLFFLPGVWLLYRGSPPRLRPWLILAASYFFYGMWSIKLLSLLVLSTFIDYWAARAMDALPRFKTLAFATSLVAGLSLLFTFKYYGFFALEFQNMVSLFGITVRLPTLDLVLPVGISFYTFQTMSYTIDVYRGVLPAEKNWITFANYVAFFPQLVAGPIERAGKLLPQLHALHLPTHSDWQRGLALLSIGMVQKVLIGDRIAPYVDQVFYGHPALLPVELLAGLLLFSVQLYTDFAGYSNIARGVGHFFGVELSRNFREPYLAPNIQQFWRDWHMTLSQWLREYVYIPLGGNKVNGPRRIRNVLLTFTLAGLWHGANITYVVWGFGHGVLIGLHMAWRAIFPYNFDNRIARTLSVALTYTSFTLLLIPFRCKSLDHTYTFLTHMLAPTDWLLHAGHLVGPLLLLALILSYDVRVRAKQNELFMLEWPKPVQWALLITCLVVCAFVIITDHSPQPFIYFQF